MNKKLDEKITRWCIRTNNNDKPRIGVFLCR